MNGRFSVRIRLYLLISILLLMKRSRERSSIVASPRSLMKRCGTRGRPSALDSDERGRGADEHTGRGEVPGAPAGGPWNLAVGRTGGRPGRGGDPGGRCGGLQRRQGCRWVRGQRKILDVNLDRLRYLDDIMPPNVTTLYSDRHTVLDAVERADLVIGAVLITGAGAPRLLEREDLARMKNGAVIVDVAIDQGGCVATSRPTTHRQPTYVVDGVVHYCVTNMPGAVGRTSTYALCNVTLPYVLQFAKHGWESVAMADPGVAQGVNIDRGRVTNQAVAATFDLPYSLLDGRPPSVLKPFFSQESNR